MKNYLAKILMNKAGENDPGGATPPATPPTASAPPAPNTPPVEGEGDNVDDLGYAKVPEKPEAGTPPKAGDKPAKAASEKPAKVENPVTGYEAEPPPVDEPAAPPVDEPPKAPPTDLEKKLEGLNQWNANKVKAAIEKIGLEGEKLDQFIEIRKGEQKEANAFMQRAAQEEARQDKLKKAAWHKELKEDPGFGGDKFLTNVTRGEKVLDEYLPELKKELTDAKQMLRPSVMRGLARLADQLWPDDQVVHGDPTPPDEKPGDNEKNDPLSFYE